MDDFYAANAEWYGALIAPGRVAVDAALDRLLPAPVPTGVALDVGAGIGTALPALRRAGADRLYAVEPSPAMRVGLMSRVALDDDLAPRTTILPGTLDDQLPALPARWGAVLSLYALGHLEPDALDRFFAAVGERLAPGGALVVGLQPPFEPVEIGWTEFGESRVGEHRWTTRGRARPDGPDTVAWQMEWARADASGEVVERRTQLSRWRIMGPDALGERCAAIGLAPAGAAPELHLYAYAR